MYDYIMSTYDLNLYNDHKDTFFTYYELVYLSKVSIDSYIDSCKTYYIYKNNGYNDLELRGLNIFRYGMYDIALFKFGLKYQLLNYINKIDQTNKDLYESIISKFTDLKYLDPNRIIDLLERNAINYQSKLLYLCALRHGILELDESDNNIKLLIRYYDKIIEKYKKIDIYPYFQCECKKEEIPLFNELKVNNSYHIICNQCKYGFGPLYQIKFGYTITHWCDSCLHNKIPVHNKKYDTSFYRYQKANKPLRFV